MKIWQPSIAPMAYGKHHLDKNPSTIFVIRCKCGCNQGGLTSQTMCCMRFNSGTGIV